MSRYCCVPLDYYRRHLFWQDDGLRIRAGIFNAAAQSECWYVPTLNDEVYVAKFIGRPGWHLASYEKDDVYDFFPRLKDALLYLRLVT